MNITGEGTTELPRSGGRRSGRWVALAALAATIALFGWFYLDHLMHVPDDGSLIDLLVYRAGGHAVLTGHSLYAADFAAVDNSPNGLAFAYPPFSALVLVPLALLPAIAAKGLMVTLNAVASLVIFVVIVVAALGKWDRLRGWRSLTSPLSVKTGLVVVAAAAVFVFSVPVQHNMDYGQVNLILVAMVALDVFPPSVPWPRGLLVGLGVAIKLTPAVFVGYFLVTRQWRALAVSVATTVLAMALGWLVEPSDTVRYLTSTAFQPARIGGLAYSSNQSLRGIIERIPALDAARGVIWLVAIVLVLALAVVAIKVSRRSEDVVAAVLSAACIDVLCSPVSWGHHWVWLSAAAVYFLVRWAAVGGARNLVAGLVVAVVIRAAPWAHLPNSDERERVWTPMQHLLGSVWALTALALLVLFATARVRQRDAAQGNSLAPPSS